MRIGHQGQNYRFKHEHLQRQLVIETSRTTTDELQLTANARGHSFTGTKIANIREHLARMSTDILPRADSLSRRYSSEIPSGSKSLSSQILQIMEFDLADPKLTDQDRDTNSEAIAQLPGHNDFTVQVGRRFNPKQLATALTEGRSVTASSFASDSKKYDTSPDGVAGSHAYTVLDVGQAENGDWQVTLYNPWGGSGTSSQGAHRGEFTISWEAFTAASNFRSVAVMNTSIPEAT